MTSTQPLKKKRQLTHTLKEAEKRIEGWRCKVLAAISPTYEGSVYLLAQVASSRCLAKNPLDFELVARHFLAGLQFGLSGLPGSPRPGVFDETSVSCEDLRAAAEAIECMCTYAKVRDAYIAYTWGGYEVEDISPYHLRFVDATDWPGLRDSALRAIGRRIERQQVNDLQRAYRDRGLYEPHLDLPDMSFNHLTASRFSQTWFDVARHFAHILLPPVLEKCEFLKILHTVCGLSRSEANEFVSLTTFDSDDHSLTLFHCPVIPLTKRSVSITVPGLLLGNPQVIIPRLIIRRRGGIDEYSKNTEEFLLRKLKRHYTRDRYKISTCAGYEGTNDKGDIDLAFYDEERNELLLAMLKAFVPPDTAEEVVRGNESLNEGLQQVERLKKWVDEYGLDRLASCLKLPRFRHNLEVAYAVIGNGFAGSDYLPIPTDVPVVDARYLLLERFAGRSMFEAIDEYEREIGEASKNSGSYNRLRLQLGEIIIELPGQESYVE